MADVIDLDAYRRAPHLSGEARCMGCRHEWMAVAPVGVVSGLECPHCGAAKGVFLGDCCPDERWACACGNDLFYVTDAELVCANCGRGQRFP